MDDAVRARNAAGEALADIDPAQLQKLLSARLDDASMTPGVLALLSARAFDPGTPDGVEDRAAGVQLIYEGLRLTRALAHDQPWNALDDVRRAAEANPDGEDTASLDDADIAADLDVVAADVLVARGFYLLARTEAADRAVETVRAFGRDQTERRDPNADAAALDRNLEADVFALAVVAGASAAGTDPSTPLLEHAAELARGYEDDLPPADAVLSDLTAERIATLSGAGSDDGTGDRVRSSATDS